VPTLYKKKKKSVKFNHPSLGLWRPNIWICGQVPRIGCCISHLGACRHPGALLTRRGQAPDQARPTSCQGLSPVPRWPPHTGAPIAPGLGKEAGPVQPLLGLSQGSLAAEVMDQQQIGFNLGKWEPSSYSTYQLLDG
jgi:hypothetical protein